MKNWRTENWQTMCPDGDKEVARIFELLHDRKVTIIQAFDLLEDVPYKFPDSELCKETINPFFEHAIEAGYSNEELTDAYETVRYDGMHKQYLPKEEITKSFMDNKAVISALENEGVLDILNDVMNLGMELRQNQLQGHSDRSGNEHLADYIENKKKELKS